MGSLIRLFNGNAEGCDVGVYDIFSMGRTLQPLFENLICIIGNGDIRTADDAVRMIEATGCDAVMVGRGALRRPWIFEQIRSRLVDDIDLPDPTFNEKLRIIERHLCCRWGRYGSSG